MNAVGADAAACTTAPDAPLRSSAPRMASSRAATAVENAPARAALNPPSSSALAIADADMLHRAKSATTAAMALRAVGAAAAGSLATTACVASVLSEAPASTSDSERSTKSANSASEPAVPSCRHAPAVAASSDREPVRKGFKSTAAAVAILKAAACEWVSLRNIRASIQPMQVQMAVLECFAAIFAPLAQFLISLAMSP